MLISRIAVLGMPSSSASSLIFLSATSSPDTRLRALYTTPYVPSPIFSIFWYFSIAKVRREGRRGGEPRSGHAQVRVDAERKAPRFFSASLGRGESERTVLTSFLFFSCYYDPDQ